MAELLNENGLVNKLATAAVLGLLVWNVATTQKLAVEVAVLTDRLASMQIQFNDRTADRYTKADARADFALMDQRVSRLEEWNANISDRLRNVEGQKMEQAE